MKGVHTSSLSVLSIPFVASSQPYILNHRKLWKHCTNDALPQRPVHRSGYSGLERFCCDRHWRCEILRSNPGLCPFLRSNDTSDNTLHRKQRHRLPNKPATRPSSCPRLHRRPFRRARQQSHRRDAENRRNDAARLAIPATRSAELGIGQSCRGSVQTKRAEA